MFFECDYRVCYGDTDKMGVVYYANYFEFFERGRTEMMRSAGFPYAKLEELGVFLPVVEAKCRYFAPAHYDDLVTLRSAVLELGRIKLRIGTQVRLGDKVLVSGEVTLATNVGGIPEIVNATNGILVPPHDVAQLATAMQTMLQNYQTYNSATLRDPIIKKFSNEPVGKLLNSLYFNTF